jgi:hypothetical protein
MIACTIVLGPSILVKLPGCPPKEVYTSGSSCHLLWPIPKYIWRFHLQCLYVVASHPSSPLKVGRQTLANPLPPILSHLTDQLPKLVMLDAVSKPESSSLAAVDPPSDRAPYALLACHRCPTDSMFMLSTSTIAPLSLGFWSLAAPTALWSPPCHLAACIGVILQTFSSGTGHAQVLAGQLYQWSYWWSLQATASVTGQLAPPCLVLKNRMAV